MRISDWSSDVCSSDLLQAANVIKAIRASKYKVDGRILPVANADIPATIFCVADLTPRLRQILIDFDANVMPDNQGFYGYHRTHKGYYEVIYYTTILPDARKRTRNFFDMQTGTEKAENKVNTHQT